MIEAEAIKNLKTKLDALSKAANDAAINRTLLHILQSFRHWGCFEIAKDFLTILCTDSIRGFLKRTKDDAQFAELHGLLKKFTEAIAAFFAQEIPLRQFFQNRCTVLLQAVQRSNKKAEAHEVALVLDRFIKAQASLSAKESIQLTEDKALAMLKALVPGMNTKKKKSPAIDPKENVDVPFSNIVRTSLAEVLQLYDIKKISAAYGAMLDRVMLHRTVLMEIVEEISSNVLDINLQKGFITGQSMMLGGIEKVMTVLKEHLVQTKEGKWTLIDQRHCADPIIYLQAIESCLALASDDKRTDAMNAQLITLLKQLISSFETLIKRNTPMSTEGSSVVIRQTSILDIQQVVLSTLIRDLFHETSVQIKNAHQPSTFPVEIIGRLCAFNQAVQKIYQETKCTLSQKKYYVHFKSTGNSSQNKIEILTEAPLNPESKIYLCIDCEPSTPEYREHMLRSLRELFNGNNLLGLLFKYYLKDDVNFTRISSKIDILYTSDSMLTIANQLLVLTFLTQHIKPFTDYLNTLHHRLMHAQENCQTYALDEREKISQELIKEEEKNAIKEQQKKAAAIAKKIKTREQKAAQMAKEREKHRLQQEEAARQKKEKIEVQRKLAEARRKVDCTRTLFGTLDDAIKGTTQQLSEAFSSGSATATNPEEPSKAPLFSTLDFPPLLPRADTPVNPSTPSEIDVAAVTLPDVVISPSLQVFFGESPFSSPTIPQPAPQTLMSPVIAERMGVESAIIRHEAQMPSEQAEKTLDPEAMPGNDLPDAYQLYSSPMVYQASLISIRPLQNTPYLNAAAGFSLLRQYYGVNFAGEYELLFSQQAWVDAPPRTYYRGPAVYVEHYRIDPVEMITTSMQPPMMGFSAGLRRASAATVSTVTNAPPDVSTFFPRP